MIFVIPFLLLTLGFISSSFSSCLRYKVRLFIWDFLISWGRHLSLWTSLLELFLLHPIDFEKLCFHFFFLSTHYLISSLISSLTHWVFLVRCCLVSMCSFSSHFSFCSWFLLAYHSGWGRVLDIISIPLNLLRLVLWPSMWSSWRTFYVHLKRMCILIFVGVMSHRYQLSPTALLCHLRLLFLYWFSIWMICPLMLVGC